MSSVFMLMIESTFHVLCADHAGRLWHKLTTEEQSKYYDQAKRVKEEHMRRYPTWSARDNYATRVSRSKRACLVQTAAAAAGVGVSLATLAATCASASSCAYSAFCAGSGLGTSSASGLVSACDSYQASGGMNGSRVGSAGVGFGLGMGGGQVRAPFGSSALMSLAGRGTLSGRSHSPLAASVASANAADLMPPLAAPLQPLGFAFARS